MHALCRTQKRYLNLLLSRHRCNRWFYRHTATCCSPGLPSYTFQPVPLHPSRRPPCRRPWPAWKSRECAAVCERRGNALNCAGRRKRRSAERRTEHASVHCCDRLHRVAGQQAANKNMPALGVLWHLMAHDGSIKTCSKVVVARAILSKREEGLWQDDVASRRCVLCHETTQAQLLLDQKCGSVSYGPATSVCLTLGKCIAGPFTRTNMETTSVQAGTGLRQLV